MSVSVELMFVDERAKAGDPEARQMLLPTCASELAAGHDLVAANQEPVTLKPNTRTLIPTGIAIALPAGYEAQVRPRSGLALKHGLTVLNTPGTIDADYRGEIRVILANLGNEDFVVTRGMRIAQLVVAPVTKVAFETKETLSDTVRGEKGFGSSGYA